MKKGHKHAKAPRKAFDEDMANFIKYMMCKWGYLVFLLMDTNTVHDLLEMKKFMTKTGLQNLITVFRPLMDLPQTYGRDQNCLDMGSNKADKNICLLPFCEITPDDHRVCSLIFLNKKLKAENYTEGKTRPISSTPINNKQKH